MAQVKRVWTKVDTTVSNQINLMYNEQLCERMSEVEENGYDIDQFGDPIRKE